MRWMGLMVLVLAAAGCRGEGGSARKAAPVAPPGDAAASPADAAAPAKAGTMERIGPDLEPPPPPRGDIMVPEIILEE